MNLKTLFLSLSLPLYLLDQSTKAWTVKHFSEPPAGGFASLETAWKIVPDCFHWIRVHNQGVAFGLGNGSTWAPIVFLFIPFLALVLLRVFWKKGAFEHILAKLALALLMTGILGNLTDRLVQGFLLDHAKHSGFLERLSQGYVVDFISVKLPFYEKIVPASGGWWPTFNVADSCVCIAAIFLFISGFREEQTMAQSNKS